MINVLFFAQIREVIGVDKLAVDASEGLTAETLRQQLLERGDKWRLALQDKNVLVAVNQTLSGWDTALTSGDEVAFFPPVTGG
ncbi:molybdopterin synthase subunit MoaD [Ferrimonas balearica DSM 9799]|uniref:Molybdopterin synthase sulfur carrier subunit n=1 Tax=Ferrimonas balearica (strain DSM 9799 / CCM 4581 / KCTC 23876 / PAT) TaxID=550540 RepID=E1SQE6_FERBD|nr:molybdopterin synthase sulfur carrier subunit [Ferrimonas balearica]ADN77917.1 molybdopterin synthase subunit MoaD [Ferrimonas balearica DSM 9799]MBW3141393.1 molybdopterin synthase sulfur carrier subunit [Ferrimonas balearica]MBW3166441.1 molybdopterin synthase sulfur carrier subunit [Ferrimonas balearica]MBY5982152.1 molybdopterin synthase sulfur carrier subunit [Ferrimonas balearica]MBY6096604.1 molybdopterin synthase sulfur carrier subunit [Ferrimonas balearica]